MYNIYIYIQYIDLDIDIDIDIYIYIYFIVGYLPLANWEAYPSSHHCD